MTETKQRHFLFGTDISVCANLGGVFAFICGITVC